MKARTIARTVVTSAGLLPMLWGAAAHSQTIQPIVQQKPDLVITNIATNCGNVAVTVRNDGSGVYINDKPIMVNMIGVVDIGAGAVSVDKALSVTHLNSGATSTVTFTHAQAPLFNVVDATVDTTSVIGESNETNNKRSVIDSRTCPLISVSQARVIEGGKLEFTATIDRRPASDASFSWATRTGTGFGTATAGTACSTTGSADYVTASGTVTFPSAEAVPTPRKFTVATCGDLSNELAETLTVVLSSARNAALRMPKSTGTIDNQALTLQR